MDKARREDTEQHCLEYPQELLEKGTLDLALTYNNKAGVKFHLPALMTASMDGFGSTAALSVFGTLCLNNFQKKPHDGHREYVAFLKSVDVSKIIHYYDFSPEQIHAIALYFLYDMHREKFYNFFDSKEEQIAAVTRRHEQYKKHASEGNYVLTLEDAIVIQDEEHRIVRDWFKAGGLVLE